VYPDVPYKVVVSGNAVARNDRYVFEDEYAQTYDRYQEYQWWLYDASPYEVDAITLGENTMADLPPQAEIDFPPPSEGVSYMPTGPLTLTVNEFTPAAAGEGKPFILREVAPGYKIGLISLRTFSNFIGATPDWDDTSKTATITGKDIKGDDLVITMVSGEKNGTINGQSYDIAEYSKSAPTGTCTALNENGTIYLPLRFLTDAYGATLSWDANTWTATIHKY